MYQIIKHEFLELDIIAMYISPAMSDMSKVIGEISDLVVPDRYTILCGDVNCDPCDSPLAMAMFGLGFSQIVAEPTHIQGRTLDHLYITPRESLRDYFIHPLYFSDHDAVCASVKMINK